MKLALCIVFRYCASFYYLFLEGNSARSKAPTILPTKWRGGWDLNPRVLADMGLAIPRPTRLGDPRSRVLSSGL